VTIFQLTALILTITWLLIVVFRFRNSRVVLLAGLFTIGLFTLGALILGKAAPEELGLGIPKSWLLTVGFALAGLVVTLAYSPLADFLASRWFAKPPTLEAFRAIQQSKTKLIAGIIIT
jgi:hypothetical protein